MHCSEPMYSLMNTWLLGSLLENPIVCAQRKALCCRAGKGGWQVFHGVRDRTVCFGEHSDAPLLSLPMEKA